MNSKAPVSSTNAAIFQAESTTFLESPALKTSADIATHGTASMNGNQVRELRLANLRTEIESGQYRVAAPALAEAMLNSRGQVTRQSCHSSLASNHNQVPSL